MVIYSACICTKTGKILLARQFVPISKIKIEEHISSLPKHLAGGQQHTQIEVDNLRYLYIPVQDLMLVLISNKASNVIEDMEILKLLYGVVIEKCKEGGVSEKKVMSSAFDLILAFDDVVTLGYRESVSVAQVMEYLEMDSSEEKTFIKQQKMRENEAKELAKRKQQEIDKKKRQLAKEFVCFFFRGWSANKNITQIHRGKAAGRSVDMMESAPLITTPSRETKVSSKYYVFLIPCCESCVFFNYPQKGSRSCQGEKGGKGDATGSKGCPKGVQGGKGRKTSCSSLR